MLDPPPIGLDPPRPKSKCCDHWHAAWSNTKTHWQIAWKSMSTTWGSAGPRPLCYSSRIRCGGGHPPNFTVLGMIEFVTHCRCRRGGGGGEKQERTGNYPCCSPVAWGNKCRQSIHENSNQCGCTNWHPHSAFLATTAPMEASQCNHQRPSVPSLTHRGTCDHTRAIMDQKQKTCKNRDQTVDDMQQ